MTDDDYTKSEWLCLGRDWDHTSNKMYYKWETHDGKVVFYQKLKGLAGRWYAVEWRRTGENTSARPDPRYLRMDDSPRRAEYEANDAIATTLQEEHRRYNASKKDSELADLISPLRAIYKKQIGSARKAAFLWYIEQEVTK